MPSARAGKDISARDMRSDSPAIASTHHAVRACRAAERTVERELASNQRAKAPVGGDEVSFRRAMPSVCVGKDSSHADEEAGRAYLVADRAAEDFVRRPKRGGEPAMASSAAAFVAARCELPAAHGAEEISWRP